jgi:hypothetical protein
MDDEGRAFQFDDVFFPELGQCARDCFPCSPRELSNVFMSERERCANCSIRGTPVRRRFEQEFCDSPRDRN